MLPAPRSFLLSQDPESGVATILLNRPERLNALTFEVYRELREVFDALDAEPSVRAVVLSGKGKAFCTGGDVNDIIGELLGRDLDALEQFTEMTCDLIAAMRRCRVPIVAALNGTVAGAGAVIATAADIRIAARSARIAFLFTKVGLSGADMGICWLLPRIIGLGRATELLFTGEFIDACRAEQIGLYNQVVEDGHALSVALTLAESLSCGPAMGLAVTKQALEQEATSTLHQALRNEAHLQAKRMLDPDFAEAYEAFVQKRTPRFARDRTLEPETGQEP